MRPEPCSVHPPLRQRGRNRTGVVLVPQTSALPLGDALIAASMVLADFVHDDHAVCAIDVRYGSQSAGTRLMSMSSGADSGSFSGLCGW